MVNADSMQVYKELRILTARPSDVDEAALPHRLYGFRPASEPYSVAAWLGDVAPLISGDADGRAAARSSSGGTGLYFKALLEGLSPVPEIPEAIREHWRAEAAASGSAALHDGAWRARSGHGERHPRHPTGSASSVRLKFSTRRGQSLLDWQKIAGTPLIRQEEREPHLRLPAARETLYARCDGRFDAMASAGALDEVRHLRDLHLDPSLPLMRAVGVRPFLAFSTGCSIGTQRLRKRKQRRDDMPNGK